MAMAVFFGLSGSMFMISGDPDRWFSRTAAGAILWGIAGMLEWADKK